MKCTRIIEVIDRNSAGRIVWHYRRVCGEPAEEIEVGGMLTTAKAVLCAKHRMEAQQECAVSKRGYKIGRLSKTEAQEDKHYHQELLPGTGLLR